MTQNPWLRLTSTMPYVLDEDRAVIERYNAWCKAKGQDDYEAFRLRTNLLPDPFIGRIDAPILFLSANPGYTDAARAARWDCESDDISHGSGTVQQLYRSNYAQTDMEYPLFFLDPRMARTPAGHWCRHLFLRSLRNELQDDYLLARRIALVDFFPYHSTRYRFVKWLSVQSQTYSRHLVLEAIRRKALIIVMRCRLALENAIPALRDYDYITAASPQSPSASPRNLISKGGTRDGFDRVVRTLAE
jgi:hypothetical protein